MTDACFLTATEAKAKIAAGKLTAGDYLEACIARIGAREPAVKAWAHLDTGLARAQVHEAATSKPLADSLLAGMPIGVKDIIDTYDMPTQHGSPIFAGKGSFGDAACVALSRNAGGVILGKTVTTEFANRHPGKTANPHNPAHTPGGSSSGSAAAVADGHVPLAFGTQTGGSVIRPAAYCGVVGYKPSFGDFSRAGIKMQAPTLDTLGLMTRSVADLALFRAAVIALPPVPIETLAGAPRIGFCRSLTREAGAVDIRTGHSEDTSNATRTLLEDTVAALAAKGAVVKDIAWAPEFADVLTMHRTIASFEASRNYADELFRNPSLLSKDLRDGQLAIGMKLSLDDYVAAMRKADRFRLWVDSLFEDVDILLAPSAPGEAPAGLGWTGDPRLNSIWTLAGTPCITLPKGKGATGLPLGVQLIGKRYTDDAMMSLAAWVDGVL